jgi:stage V sporulation protein D (sporulation-specific penicillin-binding protein)
MRINFIFIVLCLFGAAVIGQLVNIQIIQGEKYKAWAEGRLFLQGGKIGERGEIFFKNGESLAINKKFFSVFASPSEVKDIAKTAETLSQILNLPQDFILGKLGKAGTLYSPIKNRISDQELAGIQGVKLDGIYIREEMGRYFPQETMASQLVGFVDADSQGQYGLEAYYNDVLAGKDGQSGKNLNLAVDYNIQFFAEKLLSQASQNIKIEKGSVLVLDPSSGKILALANFPNFNPNSYQDYAKDGNLEIFRNEAALSLFEPGSVFKPITMASALEEGKITPQTTYLDKGCLKISGYDVCNYEKRIYPGELTMVNVLEKSINTGAVFAGKQLGNDLFLKHLEEFGFFKKTGIDLNETHSKNQELKKGYEVNFANAAFGQGVEITLMQLAKAYSALANGGNLVTPHLLDDSPQKNSEQIISSKTASQVTSMLVSVVENGFAKAAKIPGYYIAGKTGTAQVSFSALGIKKSGYSDKTVQSFVGFFPAFHPQFLILVKLDNPQTKTAEFSALPIFHDLADYIVHLYQIPPDYQL